MSDSADLPYFDTLFELLEAGNSDFNHAFSRHVHWGYWNSPKAASGTIDDYVLAAERMCDPIFELADIESNQRILDVGCGFGGTIASMNERYSKLDMVGLNIDQRQLDRASRLVTAVAENQISFVQGDACELPFPDQSFDRVLAVECIFHFPSRQRFFQEARRVLRPGGRLFVSDIVPTSTLLSAKGLVKPWLSGALAQTFGDMDNECTISDYQKLAIASGFHNMTRLDITKNTLPTHPFMRQLYKQNAYDVYKRQLAQELVVQGLSITGLLRYVLFSWDVSSPL